jgi:NAD-dependent SIR2 family protein deacetylase
MVTTLSAEDAAVARRISEFVGTGPVLALTGAGLSTDSGLPDYRGPGSPPRSPMTYRQFTTSLSYRRHYWARNHFGWRHMERVAPNAGHRALADLEAAGVVTAIITQNVDTLHQAAGSAHTIDLHGRFDRVICLDCGATGGRDALHERLSVLNPGFEAEVADVEIAPDADVALKSTEGFRVADCADCGGMLKPDIVYFGENVPKQRVERCYALVESAASLLVAGSSLTVWSGRRFVKRAAERAIPVVIVNRGETRCDDLAALKVDAGCSATLRALAATYSSTDAAR